MQHLQDATTSPLDDAPATADALAAQLLEVAPLVMRAIRAQMRSHRSADLTVPQFRALGYIHRHPGVSLSGVAEHLGLTLAATSRLIEGLVARHLVERHSSTTDRRFVTLRISPTGFDLMRETLDRTRQSLADLLAPLPDADRARIAQALAPLRIVFTPAICASDPQEDVSTA